MLSRFSHPLRSGLVVWILLAVVPSATKAAERTLFIAVDAVPFETFHRAWADADNEFLHSLPEPVPLISTFPSTTSLALAEVLAPMGVERSPGYEARYYDYERNKVRGGGLFTYEPFPWRAFFDWKVEGLRRKATSALRPQKASRKDIRQSLRAFLESSDPTFFVYYDTTDVAAHLHSPDALLPIFARLDDALQRIRAQRPDLDFDTVILSDHGMSGGEPLRNVRKDVLHALKAAGKRKSRRIRSERDVVFVPFGLVSSFVAYTRHGEQREVADVIAAVPGVAHCAHLADADGWRIVSGVGEATFWRTGDRWSYRPLEVDPLGLADRLRASGLDPASVTDADLLEATATWDYPDPLHRIVSSFYAVHNPASLVCATADDSMFGSATTTLGSRISVGRLRWTHGALGAEATLGFFTTDADGWDRPEYVRFDEALLPFAQRMAGERPGPRDDLATAESAR